MEQPSLHPDDLLSKQTIQLTEIMLRQLEAVIKQSFYQACDKMTRIVMSSCHWYFRVNTGILMLILVCPEIESYQNIMAIIPHLANKLKRFANKAIISISHVYDRGIPSIISIDEILPEGDSSSG